jgi:hypothetical protein
MLGWGKRSYQLSAISYQLSASERRGEDEKGDANGPLSG